MGNQQIKSPRKDEGSLERVPKVSDVHGVGDPRSPNVEINRTPLQQLGGGKKYPITKNVDLTKECFDKYNQNVLTPGIRSAMNQIDPRSPTLDFQRTPLAFMLKNPELISDNNQVNNSSFLNDSQISHGQVLLSDTIVETPNLQMNLCGDFSNISIDDSSEDKQNSQIIESPILKTEVIADSTGNEEAVTDEFTQPASPIVGLLETNLDYIETDLDTVRRKPKKAFEPVTVTDEIPIQRSENNAVVEVVKDLSENDPRSPSVDIARTPIMVSESIEATKNTKPLYLEKSKINTHLQDIFKYNVQLQKQSELDTTPKMGDSLLIYEDAPSEVIVSKKGIQVSEGVRTPLSCMINVDKGNSRSSTPLHDKLGSLSNHSGKIGSGKSKIPIKIAKGPQLQSYIAEATDSNLVTKDRKFNSNSLKSHRILNLNCENTPPKPRKTCWDKDSSVVL